MVWKLSPLLIRSSLRWLGMVKVEPASRRFVDLEPARCRFHRIPTICGSLLLLAGFALVPAAAEEPKAAPFFNEKDLTGWHNSNCAADTYFVKDKELITSGKPIGILHTDKQYENFELEVDWMHINKKEVGNSGIFLWCDSLPAVGTPFTRGIEVQVLVNYPDVGWATNHGDIFSIWGAKCKPDRPHPKGYERCLPSENRAKGGGEWNHYKIVANDGRIKLSVNGKEVSGVSECRPRKGYIAIESEGAECHFRNFQFKELPSTNPKPEEIATVRIGHVSLFDHVNLKPWKCKEGTWVVQGETLTCKGGDDLSRKVALKKCEVLFDWKLPAKSKASCEVRIGDDSRYADLEKGVKLGEWNRAVFEFDPQGPGAALKFMPAEGLQLRNLYLRDSD